MIVEIPWRDNLIVQKHTPTATEIVYSLPSDAAASSVLQGFSDFASLRSASARPSLIQPIYIRPAGFTAPPPVSVSASSSALKQAESMAFGRSSKPSASAVPNPQKSSASLEKPRSNQPVSTSKTADFSTATSTKPSTFHASSVSAKSKKAVAKGPETETSAPQPAQRKRNLIVDSDNEDNDAVTKKPAEEEVPNVFVAEYADVSNETSIPVAEHPPQQPVIVRKRRPVQRRRVYQNELGKMVTETVTEYESYDEAEPAPAKLPSAPTAVPQKKQKNDSGGLKQSSIMGFFKKK